MANVNGKEIRKMARDAMQYVQTSCSEFEHFEIGEGSADDQYNDPEVLVDLLGDKLHWMCKGDKLTMIAVATACRVDAHTALDQAIDKLIGWWS